MNWSNGDNTERLREEERYRIKEERMKNEFGRHQLMQRC
jgi:hypothetical protein